MRRAARLRAHLNHPPMLARHGHRDLALEDVVARRLLHINVLTRAAALYGQHRMPVIRRRNHEGVDGLVVQQIAIVLHDLRRKVGLLLHFLRPLFPHIGPHIADMGDCAIRFIREGAHDRVPAPPHTDTGDADPAVRPGGGDGGEAKRRSPGQGNAGGSKELTAAFHVSRRLKTFPRMTSRNGAPWEADARAA